MDGLIVAPSTRSVAHRGHTTIPLAVCVQKECKVTHPRFSHARHEDIEAEEAAAPSLTECGRITSPLHHLGNTSHIAWHCRHTGDRIVWVVVVWIEILHVDVDRVASCLRCRASRRTYRGWESGHVCYICSLATSCLGPNRTSTRLTEFEHIVSVHLDSILHEAIHYGRLHFFVARVAVPTSIRPSIVLNIQPAQQT